MSSLLNLDVKNYQEHFGAYKEFDSWKNSVGLRKKIEIH